MTKILFFGWLFFTAIGAFASQNTENKSLLFTDRGFCVSGDTVWVMYKLPAITGTQGMVVRFQLETNNGNLIEEIAVPSSQGWARGFLPITDSLSSGQYFVTAFILNFANNNRIDPVSKSLLVYNRFDEDISQINLVSGNSDSAVDQGNYILIDADKETYKAREKVSVSFGLPADFSLSQAVIRATLLDPLEKKQAEYRFNYQYSNVPATGFMEKNGFLLSGKVTSVSGIVQPGVLVVISLPESSGYFDYCVTDSAGAFYFFLKNAFGATDAIFQVFSGSGKKYLLYHENGVLHRNGVVNNETVVFTPEQIGFIKNALTSCFASHIFYPSQLNQPSYFSMYLPDSIPFYGNPTTRIHTGDFIDLPDFREISRELLHGFQYRVRNDQIIFRMLNRTRSEFFKQEPLRLINGIPVFNNRLFGSLKSTEIDHVDLVLYERVYGDLVLNGVVEVSLKDKSNAWLENQPNLFRRKIEVLQPFKAPVYNNQIPGRSNEPDVRQVFFWKDIAGNPDDVSFYLSDRKGIVEISVEGFTHDNRYFKSVKTIEVK